MLKFLDYIEDLQYKIIDKMVDWYLPITCLFCAATIVYVVLLFLKDTGTPVYILGK